MSVTKGSRVTLTPEQASEAGMLLRRYRAAKLTETNAKTESDQARARIIDLLGDFESGVDADGFTVVRAAEQERKTLPLKEALERAPMLVDLVKTTTFRVIR